MNLLHMAYLHKGHLGLLLQSGVPISENGIEQLTNTPVPEKVRITIGLEEVEGGGEEEVAVAPLIHSFHLMKTLDHKLTNKKEKGG